MIQGLARGLLQISLLILNKFKRINQLLINLISGEWKFIVRLNLPNNWEWDCCFLRFSVRRLCTNTVHTHTHTKTKLNVRKVFLQRRVVWHSMYIEISSCLYCQLWRYFTPFSSVSIVDFKQVNVSWGHQINFQLVAVWRVSVITHSCNIKETSQCIISNWIIFTWKIY